MIFDNSDSGSRPLPPSTLAKSGPANGSLAWIFGTILLVVACIVAGWGLMQTTDTVTNNAMTGAAATSK